MLNPLVNNSARLLPSIDRVGRRGCYADAATNNNSPAGSNRQPHPKALEPLNLLNPINTREFQAIRRQPGNVAYL